MADGVVRIAMSADCVAGLDRQTHTYQSSADACALLEMTARQRREESTDVHWCPIKQQVRIAGHVMAHTSDACQAEASIVNQYLYWCPRANIRRGLQVAASSPIIADTSDKVRYEYTVGGRLVPGPPPRLPAATAMGHTRPCIATAPIVFLLTAGDPPWNDVVLEDVIELGQHVELLLGEAAATAQLEQQGVEGLVRGGNDLWVQHQHAIKSKQQVSNRV